MSSSLYTREKYYTLVASLPNLAGAISAYKNIPLDDNELQNRLTMLSDEDRNEVLSISDFLTLSSLEKDDIALKQKFEEIINKTSNKNFKNLIEDNMRLRSVFSAILLSCNGGTLPHLKGEEEDSWGYDKDLMKEIRINWTRSNFSLDEDKYPNIIHLRKSINENDPTQSANIIENIWWDYYTEQESTFEFAIENFVLFIAKRQMIKNRLEQESDKTLKIIKDAVTNMIDKMELNL